MVAERLVVQLARRFGLPGGGPLHPLLVVQALSTQRGHERAGAADVDILSRSTGLSQIRHQRAALDDGRIDLLIRPPVAELGTLDFKGGSHLSRSATGTPPRRCPSPPGEGPGAGRSPGGCRGSQRESRPALRAQGQCRLGTKGAPARRTPALDRSDLVAPARTRTTQVRADP